MVYINPRARWSGLVMSNDSDDRGGGWKAGHTGITPFGVVMTLVENWNNDNILRMVSEFRILPDCSASLLQEILPIVHLLVRFYFQQNLIIISINVNNVQVTDPKGFQCQANQISTSNTISSVFLIDHLVCAEFEGWCAIYLRSLRSVAL